MKNKFLLALKFVSFLGVLSITSCNNEIVESKNKYSISYESSEYFTISNLPSEAYEGDTVYFDLSIDSLFFEIDTVMANSIEVNKTNLGWNFLMPSEDVTITVNLSQVGEYDDENDKLSWPTNTPTIISMASDDDKDSTLDITQDLGLGFGISSSNYVTSIKETIHSSNQDVIPDDAITFKTITSSSSNIIVGGKLVIDLKKVNEGEAYLYIELKPNNSSLGKLIKKINVVKYGEVEVETFDVKFKITNESDYNNEDLFLNISDLNYVYGSNQKELYTYYLKDFLNNEIDFKYAKGHKYYISCGALKGNETSVETLEILDWVGSGSSTSGFNQLVDNFLTLLTPNIEVDIVVK